MNRDSALRGTIVSLATIVLLLCIILCVHAISGYGLIGCSPDTHCSQVLGSRWSFILGIVPVSSLAAGIWVAFLSCFFLHARYRKDPELQRFLRCILLLFSGVVTGSALWLIWLQHWMIRAFCPYCMTAHVLGVTVSVLTVIWCVRQKTPRTALLITAGILLAACVAVLQMLTTPRTLAERGFTEEPLPVFSPQELPVTGNPDAPHIVTVLFDWQCSHCRQIHLMLPDVVDEMGGRVAFVCCAVPLSRECNPYVPQGTDLFAGSCTLLRIGLALWKTDPAAYSRYEEWFWGEKEREWYPPSVDEAMERAAGLIGADTLESAMNDPWADEYLSSVLELFGRTSANGRAAVPRLIYGNDWIIPEADNASGLASVISSLVGQ